MSTRVTVASLTKELDDAVELARRTEQPSAMTQAIVAKAKLHGHLIERRETGAPGAFANMNTEAELLAAARAELGEEAMLLIQQLADATHPANIALTRRTAFNDYADVSTAYDDGARDMKSQAPAAEATSEPALAASPAGEGRGTPTPGGPPINPTSSKV